jgi:crotonobetainyl-CoA:carnitine CoA-transferase CaiB-like acyl-CoA transferase
VDARQTDAAALVADYERGAGVGSGEATPVQTVVRDDEPWLAATLPALDLAAGSVQAVRRAAARAGATGPLVEGALDLRRVAAAFGSDRMFRLDGHEVPGFAPLSGFFRTADGWVRTHANYPHHRHRLLGLFGLHDGVGPAELAAALADRRAQDVEDAAAAAGAVVVRVRTEDEWRQAPQGRAAAEGPLVRVEARTEQGAGAGRRASGGGLPLSGLRVLDQTRVLAGPVATRTLALVGAEVLRIDPPVPAELRWQHLDTGQGKRTALLDLRDQGDLEHAQRLLDDADVLVTGYRPGSIEQLGLFPPPGVVHGRVSAWGETGPWGTRRGFDSIVQAASGIAIIESLGGDAREHNRPGALPAQVLDHASGYLLAAGLIDALTARASDGLGRDVAVALARTAAWLLDAPGRDPQHPPAAVVPPELTVSHGHGPQVTTARPALPGFDDFPAPARPWGTDHARW